jgi:hypothetical protein
MNHYQLVPRQEMANGCVYKKKIGLWLFSLSNLKLFEGGFSCPESIAYNQ